VLDDEDIVREIQLQLMERTKSGAYLKSLDVVDIVSSPELQEMLKEKGVCTPSISERTARRWLAKLNWRFQKKANGMYIDGHERKDVVEYRQAFVKRWEGYEARFHKWDNDGNELRPRGFPVPGGHFRLILVTHDESTFFQNDQRKTAWGHKDDKPTPKAKGEGQTIMVSDFLTSEWGCLRDGDDDAQVIFKAGKTREGWFGTRELLAQVDRAIDVFEQKMNGTAQGLFMFDNAPSHRKRAPDAISAVHMCKGPKSDWQHEPGTPRMRDATLPDGLTSQPLYFPHDHPKMAGWFKGMEQLIRER
ncbi:hypothetical protein BC834DRAFT_808271, partial [Gloeopeniophorella convolvens]